jgi:hypothetical protein
MNSVNWNEPKTIICNRKSYLNSTNDQTKLGTSWHIPRTSVKVIWLKITASLRFRVWIGLKKAQPYSKRSVGFHTKYLCWLLLRCGCFNEKSWRASKNAPGNFLWRISDGKSLKPKVDFKLNLTKLPVYNPLAWFGLKRTRTQAKPHCQKRGALSKKGFLACTYYTGK